MVCFSFKDFVVGIFFTENSFFGGMMPHLTTYFVQRVFGPPSIDFVRCPNEKYHSLFIINDHNLCSHLNPPRGAKYMVRAAIKQSLRVQTTHPLVVFFHRKIRNFPKIPKPPRIPKFRQELFILLMATRNPAIATHRLDVKNLANNGMNYLSSGGRRISEPSTSRI